jgi:hypothetical protein
MDKNADIFVKDKPKAATCKNCGKQGWVYYLDYPKGDNTKCLFKTTHGIYCDTCLK